MICDYCNLDKNEVHPNITPYETLMICNECFRKIYENPFWGIEKTTKDVDPKYLKVINDNFWELI